MMSRILELYGKPTDTQASTKWKEVIRRQRCPYLGRKCMKIRKSEPEKSIGTCSVNYGTDGKQVIICPKRLLDRNQVFVDCIHLLTLHEPGNELRLVSEVWVPGGSVDYCLASVKNGKVTDFVGVELQTLDTTGTVWPERQRFLHERGVRVRKKDLA